MDEFGWTVAIALIAFFVGGVKGMSSTEDRCAEGQPIVIDSEIYRCVKEAK